MSQYIEIPPKTIFLTALVILGLVFLFVIRDILLLLILSAVIAIAFDPLIEYLQKRKIPRLIGVSLIYLASLFFLALTCFLIIPPVIEQAKQLSSNFPYYSDKFLDSFEFLKNILLERNLISVQEEFSEKIISFFEKGYFEKGAVGLFTFTLNVFNSFIFIGTAIVVSFFLALEKGSIKKFIQFFVPEKQHFFAARLLDNLKIKMGRWILGQLLLSFLIGITIFIALSILGVPYALLLGLLAGILDIIPYLGPVAATIPAIFIGFLISPWIGLIVLLLYAAVQIIENLAVRPILFSKTIGLNPVLVIVSFIIGAKLAGIIGMLLAIPMAIVLMEFVKLKKNKDKIREQWN
jgi:predicted PurR-regulated permease PerM